MTNSATIYTAYHAPAPLLHSASVVPIHVGRALADAPLTGMIGDDTGDNISDLNHGYCELTALYWAWKNDTDSDAIGLMHYRRVLDLTDDYPDAAAELRLNRFHIPSWQENAEAWLAQPHDYDIVLPRVHSIGRTVAENYARAHHAQDWTVTREIVARDHPDYLTAFDTVAAGYGERLGNIALMRREIFERYCAWLFDILAKVVAADVDRSGYSAHQNRYPGFLGERLFAVFIAHEQATNPDLRLREVSILNLADATVTPYVADDRYNGPDCVNIAIAADEAYTPHAAAMLRSMIDFADPGRELHIFFLHSDVPDDKLALLNRVIAAHPNAALHAINTGHAFAESYRSASRGPSNATYNRFLMFSLFPGLDRVLYLDCDTILRRDVCQLYDTDLGDALIGAVPDWIMTRTLTAKVKTADPAVPDLHQYQRDKLQMSDAQIARYFNAGVLLFNLKKMHCKAETGERLIAEVRKGGYLFRDQDILNSHFRNDLLLLDARWNVFNSHDGAYDKVPPENRARAMAARSDPWLIHFADRHYKPWLDTSVSGAEYYWDALSRTPFHDDVIAGLRQHGRRPGAGKLAKKTVAMGRSLAEKYPVLRHPLLRIYAKLKALKQPR